jgi:ABC-type hemin transport system substrate-binding protein
MITVDDDAGRKLTLSRPARRIVSLVPSLTETLFVLGCGESLVGITRYCTEPAAAVAAIERVGGTKDPDVALVHALRPELVLMDADENRREDFTAFVGAGLNVFVSFPRRGRDVIAVLRKLGELTGTRDAAAQRVTELENAMAGIEADHAGPPVRVFCPIWKGPWMSFNSETYTHDLLALAGGLNVCAARGERYCRVALEDIATARPEVILLPDEPYVFAQKHVAALAALQDTPAWQANRIRFTDGKALFWYGARTAGAIRYLRRQLAA